MLKQPTNNRHYMTKEFLEVARKRSLKISKQLDDIGIKSTDGLIHNGKKSTILISNKN